MGLLYLYIFVPHIPDKIGETVFHTHKTKPVVFVFIYFFGFM